MCVRMKGGEDSTTTLLEDSTTTLTSVVAVFLILNAFCVIFNVRTRFGTPLSDPCGLHKCPHLLRQRNWLTCL